MKKRKKKKSAKSRLRSKSERPRAAVAARPEQEVHAFVSHAILWVTSALTAFTFLGGLQTVVDYSPWASWLLSNWLRLGEAFWARIFQLFGFNFDRHGAIPATFIFSMLFMGFGTMMLSARQTADLEYANQGFWKAIFSHEANIRRTEGIAIGLAMALITTSVVNWYIIDFSFREEDLIHWWLKWVLIVLTPLAYIFLLIELPRREFFHVIVLTISMTSLYVAMLLPAAAAARSRGGNDLWSLAFMIANLSAVMFPSKMMTIVSLARPRFWNYRMLYVWLTIGLVLTLDWIARSAISLKPPG